jgi:hypothetical protein
VPPSELLDLRGFWPEGRGRLTGATVMGEARYCRGNGANDYNVGIEGKSGSPDLVSKSAGLDVIVMFNR